MGVLIPDPGRPDPSRRQRRARARNRRLGSYVRHPTKAPPIGAARHGWQVFVDWFNGLELDESTILLAFALAVGAAAALGVVAFFKLIDWAYFALFRWPVELYPALRYPIYRPLLTAAGFAGAYWLARRLAGGEDGPNIPYVQLSVARRGGDVPTREGIVHAAASAVTLGSGGSAGSEGPVAVLGATVGSWLGRVFHFDSSRVKILVGAGAAAGIAASFNAPLAGAFFGLEEIMGDFTAGSFPPIVVASVISAVISRAFFGNHPAFPVPQQYGFALWREVVLFYPLLGVAAGFVGVFFVRTYFGLGELVRRSQLSPTLLPWIGGAIVGLIVLVSGGVLVGYGHLAVRIEVFGGMAFGTLALLTLGKIVATSITLNAGGSGGVFTPSLYIGAAFGGCFGVGLADLFPRLGLHPEAYALVGMGTMVAAATRAPITAILIVFEMTNDYAIMPPLMLATVIAYLVSRTFERDSLYSGWLARRGERIEHGTDRDMLARLSVRDAYDPNPQVIGEAAPLPQLLEHLGQGEQIEFPVVDEDIRVLGVITIADLGRAALDYRDLSSLLVAADVATPTETATLENSLLEAMRRMGVRGTGSLPVVDAHGKLVGLISRGHILAVYERAIAGENVSAGTGPPRPAEG